MANQTVPKRSPSNQASVTLAVTGNWIDTSNQAAVTSAYNSFLSFINTPSGWAGNVMTGDYGTTTQAYKDAVMAHVNWFRAMAGVPPVTTMDLTASGYAQQGAMMLSVNNQLNHFPPSTWTHYTANGADALGKSNICIGYTLRYDLGCVRAYIDDFGPGNNVAGHRRWILYPQIQNVGTGDVTPNSHAGANPPQYQANALAWNYGNNIFGPRPATRDTYVAWPPPGYVPYTVVFPRWSLSYPGADFSTATVAMTKGGQSVSTTLETVQNGYGDNTLVWVPSGMDSSRPYNISTSSIGTYQVTVSGIKGTSILGGVISYTVMVYDPGTAPVTVSFSSNPPSTGLFVDNTYVTAQSFSWTPGLRHTLSFASGANLPAYNNWSDGAGDGHDIFVPSSTASLVVNYGNVTPPTQYTLTLNASPAGGGAVNANPSGGTYDSGTSVQVSATASAGYAFSGFSGDLMGATNPQSVSMTMNRSVTASFSCTYALFPSTTTPGASASTLTIDVTTGSTCNWNASGLPVWLTVASGSPGTGTGTVTLNVAANSGASRSGSVTIGTQNVAITQSAASTPSQFSLTLSASPSAGGTLSANPPAGPYNSGTAVQITATPASGYAFAGFSGDLTGTANPQSVTMSVDRSVTGLFTCTYGLTPSTQSPGASASSLTVGVATGAACNWSVTSLPAWITVTSGASGTGSGTATLSVAANTGASRSGSVTIAGQSFTVTQSAGAAPPPNQFQLTMAASPVSGGTIAANPSGGTYNSGASVQITATPAAGYVFSGFSGDLTGATNPQSVTMSVNRSVTAQFACAYTVAPSTLSSAASASTVTVNVTAGASCAWSVTSMPSWVTVASGAPGTGSGTVSLSVAANSGAQRSGSVTIAGQSFTLTQAAVGATSPPPASTGLRFVAIAPCRVVDTRAGQGTSGAFGPPSITGNTSRDFPLPLGRCSLPSDAQAYSLNITVVSPGTLGYLSIWPTGQAQPFVSTLNAPNGGVVANAAIVPAGNNGSVSVFVTDRTDVIIDVNGYFAPASSASGAAGLVLHPVTPCRVADTRAGQGTSGVFGPPTMRAGESRNMPLPSGRCALPSEAQAYSLNVTVVPKGTLGYLTLSPSGQAQPFVSTLNSPTGRVTANAAIVPAGTNGGLSVFVTDDSDVIIDVNGYFSAPSFTPPDNSPGLLLNPVTPCRVADTRTGQGTTGSFGPPTPAAGETRTVPVPAGRCSIPTTARAYSLNATVVPPAPLGYLSAWPTGQAQPFVSTLNSPDGSVVANAAIVPAGTNGSVSVFVTDRSDFILDINGYFAPDGVIF